MGEKEINSVFDMFDFQFLQDIKCSYPSGCWGCSGDRALDLWFMDLSHFDHSKKIY